MTLSITNRVKKHIGNGVTTVFPYDFYIPDAASLDVYLYDTVTGVKTLLSSSLYSVTGLGSVTFGNVTYPLGGTPIPATKWLLIVRDVSYTQDMDIHNQGGFNAEVIEAQLDLIVMQTQQLAEQMGRTIRVIEGDTVATFEDSAFRANKYLKFDALGNPVASEVIDVGDASFASTAEAESGILSDVIMAPLTTWQSTAAYLRFKGSYRFPDVAADGVTDDRAIIQTAIDAANADGGGKVSLPKGDMMIGNVGSNIGIAMKSKVILEGVGDYSVLKMIDAANGHVINVNGINDWVIRDLQCDGNRLNQTLGVHCIRVAGTCVGGTLERLYLKSGRSYDLGVQVDSMTRLRVDKLVCEDSGEDGIDFKNHDDTNADLTLRNITILSFDMLGNQSKAGIDIRGPANLSNIHVEGVTAFNAGVRFRGGELLDTNGLGGHESNLVNFRILGNDGATSFGVLMLARNVKVSNGMVKDLTFGVRAAAPSFSVVGVHADSCANGHYATVDGDDGEFIACHAENSSAFGMDLEAAANIRVIGGKFVNNTTRNLRIGAGATDTSFIGNLFSGGGGQLDSGTDTHARDNLGWKTAANLLSATFAIDATGLKTITKAHGLAVTPDLEDIIATIVKDTAVDDAVMEPPRIISADATNIVCDVVVTSASVTVGATAKLAIRVDARP